MDNAVLVCGAGHQGLAMAAHLALCGERVNLWNRTQANISEIIETKTVSCTGVVNGQATLNNASANIEEVICDLIMVTAPSFAHKDIAKTVAPFVHRDSVIVLNPGRTFGALAFKNELKKCGVKEMPHIAETQTIVYTCRKVSNDMSAIYALKNGVRIASVEDTDIDYIYGVLPSVLKPHFIPEKSFYVTSLSNVGMVLHCAPVLMNIGWIETEKAEFKYYYDGISQSVASFIEKIDSERLMVAEALGYKVLSTADWLKEMYGVQGNNLYECIHNNNSYNEIDAPPTINCRYIMEDVPFGLVPIESLAKQKGIEVPNISVTIDLAIAVYDVDFRSQGRVFSI